MPKTPPPSDHSTAPAPPTRDPKWEQVIADVMRAHGLTRAEALKELERSGF
jgi:hypothetical protein